MMLGMLWVLGYLAIFLVAALLVGLFIWKAVVEWKGKKHDDK
jgi:hypothetical protein